MGNTFRANQFIIVPVKLMKNTKLCTSSLKAIGKKLNLTHFTPPATCPYKPGNRKGDRRPLAEELTNETRDGLREYFTADTRKLSEMLAPRIKQGLFLVGAESLTSTDAEGVMDFLIRSW